MKIVIDARFWGPEHTGIGRYVQGLVGGLAQVDRKNRHVLLTRGKGIGRSGLPENFTTVKADFGHYGLAEQLRLPQILRQEKPDLVHFPHFNIPLLFRGPFVVTIHDLIKHASRGMQTTTRAPWLYWLKYAGYRMVFSSAVSGARKIIVPSQAIKDELLAAYKIPQGKVKVTYEGVDKPFKSSLGFTRDKPITNHQPARRSPASPDEGGSQVTLKKYNIHSPYLIYAGSAYPHKNLERLMESLKYLNNIYYLSDKLSLVVVNARGVFAERLERFARENSVLDRVKFLDFVDDKELAVLYRDAEAFVFPTLSEGFGLPGLEAMAVGTPVVCSDIPVLREVYGTAALYFDPHDPQDIAAKIAQATTDSVTRMDLVRRGRERVKRYSWHKMAEETLKVYKEAVEA